MAHDNITLMIVDDEEQFLSSMGKRLDLRGFNVVTVNRGEKALEAARKHSIEVALIDLKMPGMDGEQTLSALKQEHPLMEIVILTGHGSIDSAVQCTKTGAFYYLQKPCDFEQLLGVLAEAYTQRVLNRRKLKQGQTDEVLNAARTGSPLEILRRLKQLDSEES